MPTTRVVLFDMPQLLCDVLLAILATQPDMTAVDAGAGRQRLLDLLDRDPPDVVVLAPGEPPAVHDELLRRHPSLRVVAIEEHGRRASLHEVRPCRLALGEITPESLVRAIRSGAPEGGTQPWTTDAAPAGGAA